MKDAVDVLDAGRKRAARDGRRHTRGRREYDDVALDARSEQAARVVGLKASDEEVVRAAGIRRARQRDERTAGADGIPGNEGRRRTVGEPSVVKEATISAERTRESQGGVSVWTTRRLCGTVRP